MEIAARWFAGSVAAVQSVSSRHSKPISLASLMVVWTHTSVVTPARMTLVIFMVRKISSRSAAGQVDKHQQHHHWVTSIKIFFL